MCCNGILTKINSTEIMLLFTHVPIFSTAPKVKFNEAAQRHQILTTRDSLKFSQQNVKNCCSISKQFPTEAVLYNHCQCLSDFADCAPYKMSQSLSRSHTKKITIIITEKVVSAVHHDATV